MRGFIDGEYQDEEIRGLVFLCGMRGMGKTTEMDRLLSLCTGGVLFFDTVSKHAGVFRGYAIFSEPGPLESYLRLNRGRRFRVLYQPRRGNLDTHFQKVCTIVRAMGWMIFAVDEVDKLSGARWGETRMCPEFYHLVNYGRHERVSMIATARRPKAAPAGFRGEAEMRVFRLKEVGAIDYFAEEMGDETAARLRTLPKYYYLHCVQDGDPILCGGPRGAL